VRREQPATGAGDFGRDHRQEPPRSYRPVLVAREHEVGSAAAQASDIATSNHQDLRHAYDPGPKRAMPKARQPLMIVASPIGIVPMNMDTVLWPKMRWPHARTEASARRKGR
jgi:hypothetical protein